jgi:hypothetical protein
VSGGTLPWERLHEEDCVWTLDEVEHQLRTSMAVWRQYEEGRKTKNRLVAEYYRGLATGIFVTLGATGHKDSQERLAREALGQDTTDAAFLTGLLIGTGLQ